MLSFLKKHGVSKEEVLAKAFPPFELSGDTLTWYARDHLPALERQAADVLSFFTLRHDGAFPSQWFAGELAYSRFLQVHGGWAITHSLECHPHCPPTPSIYPCARLHHTARPSRVRDYIVLSCAVGG